MSNSFIIQTMTSQNLAHKKTFAYDVEGLMYDIDDQYKNADFGGIHNRPPKRLPLV